MVQAAGNGRLDDPHIGNVVTGQGIEFQMEILHPLSLLMGFQHLIGQGLPGPLRFVSLDSLGGQSCLRQQLSVLVKNALMDQFYHNCSCLLLLSDQMVLFCTALS